MAKQKSSGSWTRVIGPGGQSRTIPDEVARRVWIAAGGRCTFCNKNLVQDEVTGQEILIGQLAHVVGWSTSKGSPRGDDQLPPGNRNTAENLMLICYDQHHVIDHRSMWDVYDADTLRRMKRQHEATISKLTALRDSNKSTVLRLVGDIASAPVHLSRRAVASALLDRDLFPDYALLGLDAEFEVDLRGLAGHDDGTELYWKTAESQIAESGERLRALVAKGAIHHLSVLALARIPILVALGAAIGEGIQVDLYPTRRTGAEGFGWTPGIPTARFASTIAWRGDNPGPVAVAVSISGSVDIDAVVREVGEGATIYQIGLAEGREGAEVICSQESVDNFTRAWRDLLAKVEADHPAVRSIDVFPAVPVVAAVAMGRALMRAGHPGLRIYDLSHRSGCYEYALEVRR